MSEEIRKAFEAENPLVRDDHYLHNGNYYRNLNDSFESGITALWRGYKSAFDHQQKRIDELEQEADAATEMMIKLGSERDENKKKIDELTKNQKRLVTLILGDDETGRFGLADAMDGYYGVCFMDDIAFVETLKDQDNE